MPSILSEDDKQTVKRTVPKASNKIHAVAVAKLYISKPGSGRWTPTGLQGAAVLANDLVGNTFWIKLVDVSPANRGVLWDIELYDTFQYNQDRTFFHSFEGEECLFGLSFADEKEARQFRKKMEEREKNASKGTRAKAFAMGPAQTGYGLQPTTQSVHSATGKGGRFGGLFGHRHSSGGPQNVPAQSIIPPRGVEVHSPYGSAQPSPGQSRPASASGIDLSDPAVQAVLQDLLQMGITEDQIEEHAGFIKSYLEQNKAAAAAESDRKSRAPPPPPPSASVTSLSPQNTDSSNNRRGPPPAPPPSRRTAGGAVPQRAPSPSPSPPPREPSPPRPRFRAPPPIADAGKYAHETAVAPNRATGTSGPPPPPRPPKTPLDEEPHHAPPSRFAVSPPFEGKRVTSAPVPPPPPARNNGPGGVPPPPPPREAAHASLPPPPPPRSSVAAEPVATLPPPPPPLPPTTSRPVPPAPAFPGSTAPPPAPPLPPPSTGGAPPPPPPPLPPPNASSGGPPPPPPMPPRGANAPAAPLPAPAPGRDGLLADIRGGAKLRKVRDEDKRDRSAAMVPGAETSVSSGGAAGGAAGAGDAGAAAGGLAGALASALAARKSKVSHSDDEGGDDDW